MVAFRGAVEIGEIDGVHFTYNVNNIKQIWLI